MNSLANVDLMQCRHLRLHRLVGIINGITYLLKDYLLQHFAKNLGKNKLCESCFYHVYLVYYNAFPIIIALWKRRACHSLQYIVSTIPIDFFNQCFGIDFKYTKFWFANPSGYFF